MKSIRRLSVGICCVASLALLQAQARPPRHIIIDTDPGVDDCFALLLAMRSPEVTVDAITVVAGNVPVDVGLPNALRMVEVARRTDIPVARGAAAPLTRKLVTATYGHGNDGMAGQSASFPQPRTQPVLTPAAELIRELVRKSPRQISIIAIGPLTNVATALRNDPDLAGLIKEIVLMGGSMSGGNITPAAEFNIYVDPEAARIVFHSGIPITMVGLDVTRKAQLKEEYIKELESSHDPVAQAAARISRPNRPPGTPPPPQNQPSGGRALHDPLALATFIDPSVVTLQKAYVEIETSGELTAGETVVYRRGVVRHSPPLITEADPGPYPDWQPMENAQVAVDVDPAKFFQMLIPRLTGKPLSSIASLK